MEQEAELVSNVPVKGFIGGLPIFFRRVDGRVKTLYTTEIFYDGGLKEAYLKKIMEMPFGKFVEVGACDLYDYFSSKYVPVNEKIKPSINFNDLADLVFDWV